MRLLSRAGCRIARQEYSARGLRSANIIAKVPEYGAPTQTLVVGAHYDTHKDSPGANDNSSGIAALLELARAVCCQPLRRSIRFVAFTNEESPFTRTRHMGSYVYAQACRAR